MKHFDNPVWPGATGALFTVLTRAEAQANLIPSFRALAANLDTRSNGLYRLFGDPASSGITNLHVAYRLDAPASAAAVGIPTCQASTGHTTRSRSCRSRQSPLPPSTGIRIPC
jgi:hypothetical protein